MLALSDLEIQWQPNVEASQVVLSSSSPISRLADSAAQRLELARVCARRDLVSAAGNK